MKENTSSSAYGISLAIILITSASLGWYFWQKTQIKQSENRLRKTEYDSLMHVKLNIEHELDSMSKYYSELRTENENLQGKITNTAVIVEQKEELINDIRSTTAIKIHDLIKQVSDLILIKKEYELILTVLRQENKQLREDNNRLVDENTQLHDKVTDLSKQIDDQIRKNQEATFKATSFRVEVERRNDKLTIRARKARELLISFDLAGVPQAYQGSQKLYLSINDEKGVPVFSNNPIKATIHTSTGTVEIIAQQLKLFHIENTQRLSFVLSLEDKISSGNYVAAIYSEKGLLGSTNFRLQ